MTRKNIVLSALSTLSVLMSGCASFDMPKPDFMDTPEFAEEAKNIKSFPKVSDAPQAPKDVRSDAAWDKDAQDLITVRDSTITPEPAASTISPEQAEQELERLMNQVHAYKADDPQ